MSILKISIGLSGIGTIRSIRRDNSRLRHAYGSQFGHLCVTQSRGVLHFIWLLGWLRLAARIGQAQLGRDSDPQFHNYWS
jgi:hypothetical protein